MQSDSALSKATPTLGVALPTYRRPECVARRIVDVSASDGRISTVFVSDNSPEDDAHALAVAANDPRVIYRRNHGNIGGGANFLRAIERCPSDYVWLRGDDDPITSNQIDAVRLNMTPEPRLLILSHLESKPYHGKGIRDFAQNFKRVQSIGWLSMIVLPGDTARRSLAWGYWGVHTGWANVCLVLGLFRTQPELEFTVVPFQMNDGDFREVGREEGARWAFFKTCIYEFPKTARVIQSAEIQAIFLKEWRATQPFKLCQTLVRQLAGLGSNERLTPSVFSPLFSLSSPTSSALATCLILMLIPPRSFWQFVVVAWSFTKKQDELSALGIAWLNRNSFAERFKCLRNRNSGEEVNVFL